MTRRFRWIWLLALLVLGLPARAGTPPEARKLIEEAGAAYEGENYDECARLFAAAVAKGADGDGAPYNSACCFALSGDTDRALEQLVLATERGWRDVRHLESDPDLVSLHDHPRWPKLIERAVKNRDAYLETVNEELLKLYEEDQADRSGEIDWSIVGPRDARRRERVLQIIEAGEAQTAEDHFHAAMVLQHGKTPEDFLLAHELALKAVELDPDLGVAKWLAAAAKDRYLWNIDEPQIYGTQFRRDGDGPWTIEPIDESAVTDEERAEWGVPPLAEAKKRAERMNQR